MRVTREIGFFSLLVLVTLFVQNASAAILPFSTFGDREGWQGSRPYEIPLVGDHVLSGDVTFTVYDTTNLVRTGETALAAAWDKPGQYIYAYQIWNDDEVLNEAILSFAVFNEDEVTPMNVDLENIGSIEDTPALGSGIEPTGVNLTVGNLEAIWEFRGEGISEAILLAGDHSWFLMFSSDFAPVVGDYEIRAPEEGEWPVPPEIPEPATIALLGIGGALMFTKRRKSAQ
jgi:hypothetical protein